MNSYIVEFWSRIFYVLGKLSVFTFVRWLWPRPITGRFVDTWVLCNLLLSIVAVFLVSYGVAEALSIAVVGYGCLRVFEISVYQVNVLLFDEYRAFKKGQPYALIGYRRMVLMLLHNYVEIIFWLAATYTYLADHFDHKWTAGARTVFGSIYSSFITMTTFGDFDLAPRSGLAAAVLLFHATVGLFMTLLSLARFVSLIPQPKSMDELENRNTAVVAHLEQVPRTSRKKMARQNRPQM